MISLLAHKHSAVIKCKDFEKMVQNAANGQMEKTTQSWKSGFVRNEMTGNGQMRGYWWLRPRAIKRMHVVSQNGRSIRFTKSSTQGIL